MKQLLSLYPKAWRARYEDEFLALLDERKPAPFDTFDIIWGALDAHLRPQVSVDRVKSERGSFMNGTNFARWTGLAGALGGILFIVGIFGMSGLNSDDEYPYTFGLGDVLMSLLLNASLLLMLAGLVGLYAKWGARTGIFGRVSLGITGIGLLTLLTGEFLQLAEILGWFIITSWWNILMIGLMLLLLGTSLFAAAGLRARLLPTWGAIVCLVGGIGSLALMGISIFGADAIQTSTQGNLGIIWGILGLVFFAGWVWLSFALWTNKAPAPVQAEPTAT